MLASHWPPMQSEANRDEAIRRHVGTPFTLAKWRVMRTFSSVGTVEEFYLLELPLKDSCIVRVRLPIGRRRWPMLNMFNIGQQPPDDAPTADCGSGPHSIGRADSIRASDRLM